MVAHEVQKLAPEHFVLVETREGVSPFDPTGAAGGEGTAGAFVSAVTLTLSTVQFKISEETMEQARDPLDVKSQFEDQRAT